MRATLCASGFGRVGQAALSALGRVGWLSRVFGSFGGVAGCGGSFLSEVFYAEQDVGRDVEKDAEAQEIFKRGQGFARLVRLIGLRGYAESLRDFFLRLVLGFAQFAEGFTYIVKFRQIFLLHIDIIQFVTV